jgi:hypothetical protein
MFACFLVRDLALPDQEALAWMRHWDGRNAVAKGEEQLQKLVKSAHAYGRRGYGQGLQERRGQGRHGHIRFSFSVGA